MIGTDVVVVLARVGPDVLRVRMRKRTRVADANEFGVMTGFLGQGVYVNGHPVAKCFSI